MPVSKLIGILLVAAIIVVAIGYGTGMLKSGEGGELQVDTTQVDAALKANAYDRADTLFAGGKYEAALETYRKALENEPDHSYAERSRYRVARCLDELGRHKEAREAYEQFLDKHPGSQFASQAKKYMALMP